MRRLQSLAAVLLVVSSNAGAGCIGPVIMGECRGREVPWDTSGQGTDIQRPGSVYKPAPQIGTPEEIPLPIFPSPEAPVQRFEDFYRRDPRDPSQFEPQEHQGRFR